MNNTMGSEGINKLAGVVQRRMHQLGDKPPVLDFGVIQSDMSLLTNRFPKPIPKEGYIVCRQLTLGATGDPLPPITVPAKMRSIASGDRVLVAWVGDDAVIVDIILPGTAV